MQCKHRSHPCCEAVLGGGGEGGGSCSKGFTRCVCVCKGISLNHSGVAIGGGVVGDGSSLANCNGVAGLGPSNSRSGSGPGSGKIEHVAGASRTGSGTGEGVEAGS